jgi:hypothetical protein
MVEKKRYHKFPRQCLGNCLKKLRKKYQNVRLCLTNSYPSSPSDAAKNKDTVLFLGVWEQINNPYFNSPGFEGIRDEAGRNSFYLSAKKWIDVTGAKGHVAAAGRYGGGAMDGFVLRQLGRRGGVPSGAAAFIAIYIK